MTHPPVTPMPFRGPMPEIRMTLPAWVEEFTGHRQYRDDGARMGLAMDLARENVLRGTGGPFGAVVCTEEGFVAGAGVNGVARLNDSVAHAEILALGIAERRLHSYTLRDLPEGPFTLYSSCDPCAMCLGAVLWSGVSRLVTGASRDDAEAIGFDEGPVFPESYAHLEGKGIRVERGVLRKRGREILALYREGGGPIY